MILIFWIEFVKYAPGALPSRARCHVTGMTRCARRTIRAGRRPA
jgi:hypothetical protein